MAIRYNKLWDFLKSNELNKTYLRTNGVHPTTIAKMGRNEFVDIKILDRICEILKCDFSDIMEYVEDTENKTE